MQTGSYPLETCIDKELPFIWELKHPFTARLGQEVDGQQGKYRNLDAVAVVRSRSLGDCRLSRRSFQGAGVWLL